MAWAAIALGRSRAQVPAWASRPAPRRRSPTPIRRGPATLTSLSAHLADLISGLSPRTILRSSALTQPVAGIVAVGALMSALAGLLEGGWIRAAPGGRRRFILCSPLPGGGRTDCKVRLRHAPDGSILDIDLAHGSALTSRRVARGLAARLADRLGADLFR
uniref:Uncharacterized protein n=1 Tax=Caulobacter sp. (strain K31) TaxID=366602 RepID=B0T991_CAUSK